MFTTGNKRREFAFEYEDEAVKLVINTGRLVAVVAPELGSVELTLGDWVKAYRSRHEAGDEALTEEERAELVRLREECSELKLDRAFLKKAPLFFAWGTIGYVCVAFELTRVARNNFMIKRMARLLEVSRAGFYARLRRKPSGRAVRTGRIEQKEVWFVGDSDRVSGAPKILADLREDGETISRKTVATVMPPLGLQDVCAKRWRTTTVGHQPRRRLTGRRGETQVEHRSVEPGRGGRRLLESNVVLWTAGPGFLPFLPRFFPNALHHELSRQIRHAVRSAIECLT